jgi:hypothetical protein
MKILTTGLLAFFLFPLGLAAQDAATVEGSYLEARSGEVYTCGCLFSSETVTRGREAILVWNIARGTYQGAQLAGIKVAAVIVADTNLGAFDGPRRTALYIDGAASDPQQQAIVTLWRRDYTPVLGEITSVSAAAIRFEKQGKTVRVDIPGIVRVEVRKAQLPEDAHPGSYPWYQPFVPLQHTTLATTLDYEYQGKAFARQWSDFMPSISSFYGDFSLRAAM